MPDVKKSILQNDYAFENNYIIPSSFGLNQKQKYEYFSVEESKYEEFLVSRIKEVDSKRPKIIFFKGQSELYSFFNSPLYDEEMKSKTLILTEEHDPSDR